MSTACLSQKYGTLGTLGTEIIFEHPICQDLKVTFDTTFSLNVGQKSGKSKSSTRGSVLTLFVMLTLIFLDLKYVAQLSLVMRAGLLGSR